MILVFLAMPITVQAKTQWKRGMWIGAASGAVVGGTTFAVLAAQAACDPDTDFEICSSAGGVTLMGIGGAVLGGLVGMGIGALIGSNIEKKEPMVLVAPNLFLKENEAYGGISLIKSF